MKSRSRIAASAVAGDTRLDCIRSCAPIHLRRTPDAVYLVGGAAGPLGGDDLLLEIDVGAGATLVVRSAAASVALPGPGISSVTVYAHVAAGGCLHWLPEPVIAGARCNHRLINRVTLEPGARLLWRDELVLGRSGERPGDIRSRIDVTFGGRPLLRNELWVGPGMPAWDGPAIAGAAGAVGSLLMVSPKLAAEPLTFDAAAAILPLEGPAALAAAAAADGVRLRDILTSAEKMLRIGNPASR